MVKLNSELSTLPRLPPGRDLDYEKDSLHIMPLVGLPLQTPGLRQSRMIKNLHLDSMVEIFKGEESGSGQIMPSKLGNLFEWPPGEKHPDGVLIAKLGLLQSFDVYSLRIQLRNLGIEVEDISHLRLSESKRRALDAYMRQFTRPLTELICAETGIEGVASAADLVNLMNGSGGKSALNNLRKISRKLKIILSQLPDFLTDYGDVFLSLAYFKDQSDAVMAKLEPFLKRIERVKGDETVCRDQHIRDLLDNAQRDLMQVMAHVAARMSNFDKHTATMWENLDSDTFRRVKLLIEGNHSTIGGLLCGLLIQLEGYESTFRKAEPSNQAFVDYVSTYIKPATERLKNIERSSRLAAAR